MAGVYALLGDDARVVYIGQTGNFRQRIETHLNGPFGEEVKYALCYQVTDHSSRLVLETLMILRYFPERNRALMLGTHGDGAGAGGVWEIKYPSKGR